MPYCSNCGTQNSETAKFCVSCGTALQNVTTGQKTIPQPPPSSLPLQQLGIGSKVSFTAGDGKAYTGTIKEAQGDHYKIKYDAFNFETWLNKNQFVVVAGTTMTTPTYSAAPQTNVNPQAIYSNTPTSAPGMGIITHLGFWGSIIILIGFFTNWINAGYMAGQSISGFTFIKYAGEILDAPNNEAAMFMLIVIAVIVISAIICLLYILGVGLGRGAFTFFKILPLLAIIGFIIYSVIKAKEAGVDPDIENNASGWKILGIGIYLTLIGSLALAISRNKTR